jgi:hypothetical protein
MTSDKALSDESARPLEATNRQMTSVRFSGSPLVSRQSAHLISADQGVKNAVRFWKPAGDTPVTGMSAKRP